jgi:hypothetical protein
MFSSKGFRFYMKLGRLSWISQKKYNFRKLYICKFVKFLLTKILGMFSDSPKRLPRVSKSLNLDLQYKNTVYILLLFLDLKIKQL